MTEPNLDLPLTNLLADHAPQPWSALLRLPTVLSAYEERVATLREYGEADGITLRAASEDAFLNFIKSNAYTRQASLVLLDNGNLRAVWKSDDGSHVGVQFRGGQAAGYVIFKRRDHGAETSRVAGKDTLDGVRGQIRAFGLEKLMRG
ncbi:hypothetical protein [Candidatus Palauibacter sp.]|uniref:hypothetical protein n=1 Tax=Candidatus Palauibacter sp. TaxID=3101350 RepID=UPI003B0263CE